LKVAGYIGVIDERLDLSLIADLARELDDWTIRMVGPVTKIDEADLPRAANIEYPGMVNYENLPDELAGFDVALMPFALNEATTSISPTKTLEYFAAGLPVVSTRVPDVVADYGDSVHLADDAAAFATACRKAVTLPAPDEEAGIQALLHRREWDYIADAMNALLESTRSRSTTGRTQGRGSQLSGAGVRSSAVADRRVAKLSMRAATEGVQERGIGSRRRGGEAVAALADADAASATSNLRVPLQAKLGAPARLHPQSVPAGDKLGLCPTCLVPVPCPAAQALQA
jgi:Glycosyl transferases group 1